MAKFLKSYSLLLLLATARHAFPARHGLDSLEVTEHLVAQYIRKYKECIKTIKCVALIENLKP